ncbi:hypothetical protein [uncultured Erythrobacter sp.]|uniref:hypothetical protein n=1 Tax=uncultured Erythrobacter sp. TaxID=263913 RepID=UPI002615C977|nr:hypothetical protein [uncultured Erythrobacter sp.]
MFGRKGLKPEPKPVSTLADFNEAKGFVATPEHAHAAGELFFELCYNQLAQNGDAVGVENFIGLLASAGGVTCIATSLIEWDFVRMQPNTGDLILEQQVAGNSYYCGELPTRYLYESELSLLNIALQYAMKHGAPIQHDFLHEPIGRAMESVGTPHFGIPRLTAEHTPDASPLDLAKIAWPQAEHTFDSANLALEYRPAAMGYAIGKAIDTAAGTLDPLLLAQIAVEHAVPMSMVDPAQFWDDLQTLKANAA